MKHTKRIIGVILALMLVFTMGISAFAANESGSITIKGNDTVSVEGKTFRAYKILDATLVNGENAEDGIAYTVPAALVDFYSKEFGISKDAVDFDTQVTEKISAEGFDLEAFAKKALAAAKEVVPAKSGSLVDGNYVISNLSLGYYVVEDEGSATPISAIALTTTAKNAEIDIKASKPTPEKTMGEDKVSYNNAAIGDTIPFDVTVKVPDMRGYKKYYFVLNDTMSKGFTFNNDVTVTIDGTALAKNVDYTVETSVASDGSTSIKVILNDFIQYKALTGKDVVFSYSGTLNEDAVIGTEGNPNNASLIYSNNPNTFDEGEPENPNKPGPSSPVGETPASETRTYVTGIRITKTNATGETLTGAEFRLTGTKLNTVLVTEEVFVENENGTFYKLTDGTYTTEVPNVDNAENYEDVNVKYSKEIVKNTITKAEDVEYVGTVDSNGILCFEGLAAGEYEITEIKAPSGYNLLKDPVKVKIDWTEPTAPSTDCVWTALVNGESVNFTDMAEVSIVNETGKELPSTGGIGTTIFYVLGAVLVAGAVVLLVAKRRMGAER